MEEDIKKEEKSNGALWGIVVIILVLLVGGYWFWKQNRAEFVNKEPATDELNEISADEIIFEDETSLDELFLDDDLTTFDEVDSTIQ
ncbi:hypothetical protein A3I25_01365 [Candidatus Nomurabacteria bacterium RIFCSPLOWO2_02_FULL_42_17]|uniref:Uncharacterized protein n=2 Tax=Candidatus Nomuraibacteriota TaxID=1752729 RepID=A0A1F6WI44_9BACT|nr:MAG: hypothetical protein A3B93_00690 [Candidatus Nomurabacteria bacterium RIFCSPHIGHO2_02_FULL_42_24]OGI96922.1 MAG: hypothetical protein A3I25_01365 [Candidatus Nomurabacteria bacterium RIFCSPLOWO2_02_FULL_42_17]